MVVKMAKMVVEVVLVKTHKFLIFEIIESHGFLLLFI